MVRKQNKVLRRRIAGSSVSSVISISLVLLLVGVAAVLFTNAGQIENYFKENIHITAFLKKGVSEKKGQELSLKIEKEEFVKSARYVSVQEGTDELVEMLGEDFVDVFATSPVPSSIEIKLYSQYMQADSLAKVMKIVERYPNVESVSSQAAMVESIGYAMTKAAVVLGVVVILLLFISIVLISNTIRLIVYSDRFSIRTMQLVGASKGFISRPFARKAAFMGLGSGLIACGIIAGALYYAYTLFPALPELLLWRNLAITAGGVLLLGMLICVLCAQRVMGRMLKSGNNEIYG